MNIRIFECSNCGHKPSTKTVFDCKGDCDRCGDTVTTYTVDAAEHINDLEAKLKQLKKKVSDSDTLCNRWRTYAEHLEYAGDTLATVTVRNGRSHDQWHKAKETKPYVKLESEGKEKP